MVANLSSPMSAVRRMRFETFGGIVELADVPALVFVDRAYIRRLGFGSSQLWKKRASHLSAPVEAHVNLTHRCMLSCAHCTTDAAPGRREMTRMQARRAIDVLAEANVFHVALGGGEPLLREDLFELARHVRERQMTPTLTTNGHTMTRAQARSCRVFAQVNVSLDGIGSRYAAIRGSGSFSRADRALKMLRDAGVTTGINCVVAQNNFDALPEIVDYAQSLGLCEVLLLRLKPSGRARRLYPDLRLTSRQGRQLYPHVVRLARQTSVRLQMDCSWTPFVCFHRPSKRALALLGTDGCGGADLLLGVNPDGAIDGCSHHPDAVGHVLQLRDLWHSHPHFRSFRSRRIREPRCQSCAYFDVCRGGCPLFALFLHGTANRPDPECPRLQRHQRA